MSAVEAEAATSAYKSTRTGPSLSADAQLLGTFSFLWAAAVLWHLTTHGQSSKSWIHLGLAASATGQLIAPDSVVLLLITSGASLLVFSSPSGANHEALVAAVGATFALAGRESLLSCRVPSHSQLVRALPTIQWCLIVLYSCAFLHKLNTDYLTPDISCAVRIVERVTGMQITSPLLATALIYGSLGLELFLPLGLGSCLASRKSRWRTLTICVGTIFHCFVGMRYAAFSLHVMAIYVTVIPLTAVSSFRRALLGPCLLSPARGSVVLHTVLLAVVATANRNAKIQGTKSIFLTAAMHLLLVVAWLSIATAFFQAVWRAPAEHRQRDSAVRSGRTIRFSWLPPLGLLFIGMNPYLGLRTVPAFSMFSNLRTEGGCTNSLVVGPLAAALARQSVWPVGGLWPMTQVAPFQNELLRVAYTQPASIANSGSLQVLSSLAVAVARQIRAGTNVELRVGAVSAGRVLGTYKDGRTISCHFYTNAPPDCPVSQLVADVESSLGNNSEVTARGVLVSSWLRFREVDDLKCRW